MSHPLRHLCSLAKLVSPLTSRAVRPQMLSTRSLKARMHETIDRPLCAPCAFPYALTPVPTLRRTGPSRNSFISSPALRRHVPHGFPHPCISRPAAPIKAITAHVLHPLRPAPFPPLPSRVRACDAPWRCYLRRRSHCVRVRGAPRGPATNVPCNFARRQLVPRPRAGCLLGAGAVDVRVAR